MKRRVSLRVPREPKTYTGGLQVIEAQQKQNDEWFRLLDEGYADPRENIRMRKVNNAPKA